MGGALTERFEAERPRLRAIATQLVGPADAEDVVQETWLRLQAADADRIENLPAWLTTVTSRLGLDRLRATHRRDRSWSVEPWRDEPVAGERDPAETVAQGDQISVALHVVMELLSPAERIAFMLHDVFGLSFDEIATVLDRSPDAARQLASRARRRVRGAPEPQRSARLNERVVVDAWLAAVERGDLSGLLGLLDGGAVLRADFGSRTQILVGAEAIVEQALLASRLAANSVLVRVDRDPGVAAVLQGRVASLMIFELAGDQIVGLEVLADPERLAGLTLQRSGD